MASNIPVTSEQAGTGGYKYKFVEGIGEENNCRICSFVMRDAVQTECGHHFCSSCITNYIQTTIDYTCPACHARYDSKNLKVFNDEYMRNRITSKFVYCPFLDCPYIAPIYEMEQHIKICEYGQETTCNFCHISLLASQRLSHEQQCPKMRIQCPHNCHETFAREFLPQHEDLFNSSCFAMVRQCPYIRCAFTGVLYQLQEHLRDSALYHAGLYKFQILELNDRIEQLDKKCSQNRDETEKIGKLQLALEQTCYGSKQKMSCFIRNRVTPYPGEDWEHYQEFVTFPLNGKLIWIIENFRDTFYNVTSNTMIYSTPFYNDLIGFKLCCYLLKDIDELMKLNFFLMKGKYDDILDKNNLSLTGNVVILNNVKSTPIVFPKVELRYQGDSQHVGSVELTTFAHFCMIIGAVTSLYLQVEVK